MDPISEDARSLTHSLLLVRGVWNSVKLVKSASNFALGKIQIADRKLRFWGLRGGILLALAASIGLGIGLLDSETGLAVGAVLSFGSRNRLRFVIIRALVIGCV